MPMINGLRSMSVSLHCPLRRATPTYAKAKGPPQNGTALKARFCPACTFMRSLVVCAAGLTGSAVGHNVWAWFTFPGCYASLRAALACCDGNFACYKFDWCFHGRVSFSSYMSAYFYALTGIWRLKVYMKRRVSAGSPCIFAYLFSTLPSHAVSG